MVKNALLFVSGCLTALVGVALYLGQPTVEPSELGSAPSQSGSPTQPRSVVSDGVERVQDDSATVTATDSVEVEYTDRLIVEPPDDSAQDVEARMDRFAESLQSTPEEVMRLMEENLNA